MQYFNINSGTTVSHPSRLVRVLGLATAAAFALTACGAASSEQASPSTASATVAAADKTAALVMHNAWVKAASSGMTAAFGEIENSSDQPVQVVAARSSASGEVQLHETKPDANGAMMMSQVKGGFTIPAHGTLALEPGANHLMFMGVTSALKPGDDVTVTLEFADASTFEFTAPVKDFAGANESYSHGTK